MQSGLLLVLTLLGMASALVSSSGTTRDTMGTAQGHLSPQSQGTGAGGGGRGYTLQPVPAGREEGSRRCFMVVKALCTYKGAQVRGMGRSAGCQCQASTCVPQSYCQDIYKGQLPSVHSTATNKQLRKLAATYTYCNLWIRGVTRCKTSWEDLSPWNYAKWASRQPCRWFRTYGLWRSRACFLLHPFLCQY
uniref:C-type lectin domain-containing protein n=1 Tax=Phasianus colchicus TaxID=9054 RepID=A0A669PI08_PHACC